MSQPMADLHALLLAQIDEYATSAVEDDYPVAEPLAALRAVVYLHPTEQHYTIGQDNRRRSSGLFCRRCKASAPCEEIRVIAEKLGVKDQERIEKESPTDG